jgi:hypothetical protein
VFCRGIYDGTIIPKVVCVGILPFSQIVQGLMMLLNSTNTFHIIDKITLLRLAVGYLGQHKQSGWWDCNFLDATGIRFLETTFPRTAWAAALRSTTEAACIVHDQALGRIGSFHLFRLPPALEDQIEHAIDQIDWSSYCKQIKTGDAAMDVLRQMADAVIKAPIGPVQVGMANKILTSTAIRELAAHYYAAFKDGIRCYPYFAPEKT